MELALSLGDTPKPFSYLDKSQKIVGIDLGFCMAAGKSENDGGAGKGTFCTGSERRERASDPPVQLDLLPFSPLHTTNHQPPPSNKFPFLWLTHNLSGEAGRGLEVKLGRVEEGEEGTAVSSPNSAVSSFHQMDHFSIFKSNKRDFDLITGTAANNELGESTADRGGSNSNSRGISDDEENGMARKKLRLSKEQSAFLEDSFKEHNTLNPRQKLALAKELNLRPRQVEVWFQNRRARTKLKQTEVDCEYLKRCCETLTEENRRLQKELQELRALKASQPFYNHLPATTLTMCPSCERVATTTNIAASTPANATTAANKPSKLFSLSPPNANVQQAAS